MFLERVKIENIRSLRSVEIDMTDSETDKSVRKWTLLVGENGTGKSTILKCIGLILGGSEALPHILGNPSQWVRHGEQQGKISATLRTSDWEERKLEFVINADDNVRTIYSNNLAGLELLDEALEHASQNYFTVAYGPFRRVSSESGVMNSSSSVQGLSPRAESLITLFDKDAQVHPLQSWAMDLDYQRGEEGIEIVRESMNKLMPDVEFVGIEKKQKTLIFNTPDGHVPLEHLSDGYQNVAAWIGDLLYRVTEAFAHYKKPLEARGLLLIDEVDAHLHPAWQRRLRQFLSNTLPNFQIVATTHSALTLQQAHHGDATVLSRNQDNFVEANQFPTDPSKLRLHQIYDLAFKIDSLDSWEIEQSKNEYRKLSAKEKDGLSDNERIQLEQATRTLEILPDHGPDGLGNEAMQDFLSELKNATAEIAKMAKE
ncbi:MAG: chromosome segregation protein SMC [Sphingopyxis sp.]|nr:MAG: chromosome segregation protein SMC [Sphingopyxis sp.]